MKIWQARVLGILDLQHYYDSFSIIPMVMEGYNILQVVWGLHNAILLQIGSGILWYYKYVLS